MPVGQHNGSSPTRHWYCTVTVFSPADITVV
jgi:hypothetical protein